MVSAISSLWGFTIAKIISTQKTGNSILLLSVLILPIVTPILIRTYAWVFILQNQGIVNKFLLGLGLISKPIDLVFNSIGNTLGLVHLFLPYSTLLIYFAYLKCDRDQILVARTLGISKISIFWNVEFPQVWKSFAYSSILIFILCSGAFITPSILGGPKQVMISQIILSRIDIGNLNLASGLSVIHLISILFVVLLAQKIFITNHSILDKNN